MGVPHRKCYKAMYNTLTEIKEKYRDKIENIQAVKLKYFINYESMNTITYSEGSNHSFQL